MCRESEMDRRRERSAVSPEVMGRTMTPAYIIGVCAAVAYVAIIVWYGKKRAARLQKL